MAALEETKHPTATGTFYMKKCSSSAMLGALDGGASSGDLAGQNEAGNRSAQDLLNVLKSAQGGMMKKSGSSAAIAQTPIGAPLDFVVKGLQDEAAVAAMNSYRLDYASYRLGNNSGAKGEVKECYGFIQTDEYAPSFTFDETAYEPELQALIHDNATLRDQLKEALEKVALLEGADGHKDFSTPDTALNTQQLAARSAVRGDMADRTDKRAARVRAARADVEGNVAQGSIAGSVYNFTTGAPVKTDVVVARGVVANPTAASFEIIPMTSASSPLFVFTDETVNGLYGDAFVNGFKTMGYRVNKIVLPDGEDAKTLAVYAELADRVLSIGIDKHSVLISLGGGAVANVCGFIASTLHRGIGLIHFPTTLLAQCDASISHKQAVNAPHGKNLVGAYYAPIRIVVDPDVLQTLDDWLLPDGLGEIVKHALCQDTELLDYLESYEGPIDDPVFLEHIVRRTIELKCEVIDIDPKEKKEAVVLVYGHEAGHAVEGLSHRKGTQCCLSHGQAVAVGCVVSARIAHRLGMCDEALIQRTIDLCQKYQLPTQIPSDQNTDRIMAKMPFNKTWTAEGSCFALLERPGKLFNVDGQFLLPVTDDVIAQAVEESIAPFGTEIRGAGSSGSLRRSRAPVTTPGAGWTNVDDKEACEC